MRHARLTVLLSLLCLAGLAACYTPFSPERVRHEIVRQTGADPQTSFEVKLGGATMRLVKTVASKAAGEPINFGGITRIDLALFEAPEGKPLDFSKMRIWGWDRLVQAREADRSFMVLVRTNGETLADLVLVAESGRQVLYGRLKGKLDRNLPSALERALKVSGFDGLKEHLLSAARGGREERAPQAPTRPSPR